MESPTIADFYRDKSVLITGATGFMGKVLLEKLLRSCPDIRTIFTVMRSKKGKTPEERVRALFQLPLFESLVQQQPDAIDKVVPMVGDVMALGLGLSEEDIRTLEEEVAVVFHVAATVKFDDPIKSAIFMNVRGTREVLHIASKMKKLKALLHVSTTYCNTDRLQIDEQVYPAPADWRKIILAAETVDEGVLQTLTPQLLGVRPNTYTYTKALGEHVVDDHRHTCPVVIFRPSIVISTLKDPMPGWMDNFNGPVGLMAAGGKGILRTIYADPANTADYMAVDVAIRAMIIAAWRRGIQRPSAEMSVYNCSTQQVKSLSMSELFKLSLDLASVSPTSGSLWHPGGGVSSTFITFYIRAMLLHILPALFIDAILYMMNMKPMLLRLQRRIFIANTALEYFLHHEWQFSNSHFLSLEDCILPQDRELWSIDYSHVDVREYLRQGFIGGRTYLLKEDPATLPQARVHFNRMFWLDRTVRAIFYTTLAWYVYTRSILQTAYFTSGNYLSAVLLDS